MAGGGGGKDELYSWVVREFSLHQFPLLERNTKTYCKGQIQAHEYSKWRQQQQRQQKQPPSPRGNRGEKATTVGQKSRGNSSICTWQCVVVYIRHGVIKLRLQGHCVFYTDITPWYCVKMGHCVINAGQCAQRSTCSNTITGWPPWLKLVYTPLENYTHVFTS